jgi:hypothetical protein
MAAEEDTVHTAEESTAKTGPLATPDAEAEKKMKENHSRTRRPGPSPDNSNPPEQCCMHDGHLIDHDT